MKFPVMHRRMRNGRSGTRSTARRAPGTYTPPDAPVAEAGSNQVVLVNETVSFNGLGSSGTNLSYSWDFGTGATPVTGTGSTPSCSYSTIGDKTVTLTVTDDAGATASDTVTITVHSAPIAEAGSDQTVLAGATVNFDGSGSSDPEGGALTYSWDFGADATPSTGTGSMPSCSYSTTGTKTVTLTVTDPPGATASDTVTITVHNAPIPEAGDNQDVSVDATVRFDGSDSSDPDGGNLTYSWDFGTGATPATGTGSMPSCSYSTTGAKTVTLTVTDDENATASDTVTITVHSLPVAEAGDNQSADVNEAVSFDGSGSSGTNLSYSWDFGTDATPATGTGSMPSCSYTTPGDKVVRLTVTDAAGATAKDTVTIHVYSIDNPLPVADAGSDQTVLVGETVHFDGSGSTGNNLGYSWDFGDGATPSGGHWVTSSCTYSTTGVKTVTLTINQGSTIELSDTVTITVHEAPIADAGSDQTVTFGSEVSFDGSGSSDPDGGALIYSWDFGTDADPATSNSDKPFCLYGSTGAKTVTLTVTDDEGVSRSDTVTITVHDAPIADAGHDQIVNVDTQVSFDGSGSRDPDGGELTYSWDFGADATDTQDVTGSTPSCSYTMTGAKTVTLTVTDDEGVSRSDTVTITVHDPPVANAGSDQIVTFGSEVSFDGSGSTGNNLSYLWDFGADADPATSNSDKPFCLYSSTGPKTVTLTVTDSDTGLTDSDTVTITVIDVGVTVIGTPQVVAVTPVTRVLFTGTVSNAPENATLSYSWSFDDGAIYLRNVNGLMPSCQYVTPGDKTVTLTVGITIGDQTVEVEGTCVITVFKAYAGDPQIVAVDDTVDFTGRVENAPAGADLSYSWDFGTDATPATGSGVTPSCSYTTAGDKTVRLTVSFTLDGESMEGSGDVKITVLKSRLRVQGVRGLSPLEKAAVQLVFGNSFDPDAISQGVSVQVDEVVTSAGVGVNGSYGAGIIRISRVRHQFAEELDGDTTVDDIDLTIPNNIKYLATLVHEVGHHWQSIKGRYNDVRIPKYEFNNEVLESLDFVCKEEHAAVGQVYFILKWQLHHGHDPINITDSAFAYKNVGPVNRYASIADIPPINGDRYIDPPEAIQLVNNFDRYLEDLRR